MQNSTERTTLTSLITRIRDRIAGDGGFTLLETLAVMVIVGLLAAITIPQISKWREKAYVTGMKTDARNLSLAIEANYVDTQAYPVNTGEVEALAGNLNTGVSVSAYVVVGADGFEFTLASSKISDTNSDQITFNSTTGGLGALH